MWDKQPKPPNQLIRQFSSPNRIDRRGGSTLKACNVCPDHQNRSAHHSHRTSFGERFGSVRAASTLHSSSLHTWPWRLLQAPIGFPDAEAPPEGDFRFLFLADSELRHIFMLIHEKVSVELVSFTGCQGEKVKPVYIKLKFCCNSPSSSVPPHLQCRSARGDGGTHNNVSLTWARRGAFVAPSFQLHLSPLSHLSPDSTSIPSITLRIG